MIHWMVIYCTKAGHVSGKHYHNVAGYVHGWKTIVKKQPIWAIGFGVVKKEEGHTLSFLNEYGTLS